MYPISDTVKTLFDAEQRRVLKISYADSETDVVTGDIVSINDAAATKAEDLSVAIEPVQDLHGYDSPWPAGGGKNRLKNNGQNGSQGGITWEINADGSITLSGTAGENYVHINLNSASNLQTIGSGNISLVCSASASYNPSIEGLNFQNNIYADGTYVATIQKGATTHDYSGERIEVGLSRLRIAPNTVIPSGTVFYPAIEIGTVISSTWTPYSNICPITGWTGVNVTRTGKNLVRGTIQSATITTTGVISANSSGDIHFCAVKAGEVYTATTDETYLVFAFYNDVPALNSHSYNGTRNSTSSKTFTAPIDGYIAFRTTPGSNAQLELGSTATDYEPYQGDTYDISFPSEAGTVYGGMLDVTTGLLTVDRVRATLTDFLLDSGYPAGDSYLFSAAVSGSIRSPSAQTGISDKLPFDTTILNQDKTGFYVGYDRLWARIVGISTLTDFESLIPELTAVYPLATPQTYQLTPTEVNTLLGDNTIWADTGAVTVEYHPVATITDADVDIRGFAIDRYCCNGEKLEVGTAISGQMTLRLKNTDGRFDSVVFEGTELFAEIGIADWSQTTPDIHWIPCGYFTPDVQPRRLNTIALTCLDRMTKFDVIVDANDLSFPTTVTGLITQANTICGVSLAASIDTLPNANVAITALPSSVGDITYRNLIQWCAGIMGTNAWIDWDGLLRFTWYDGATEYEMTTANRFNSDLYENDLTITGVAYTNDSGIEIVEGTDDYAIDLTGNALAGPIIATVLPNLFTEIDGFAYRPFTATVVSAPYLWPMDLVTFVDKNGLSHDSALTNVAFNLNGMTALESRGMTYAVNERAKPKGVTKEQAQLISEAMERVETDIDESLTQEDIFNRLVGDPPAQGLILYNGQLYINASYINAGYLNADHIRGGTLTLGGQNNQNGVMQVLDASGNVVGTINNDGVDITDGSVIAYSSDRQERALFTNGQIVMQYLGQGTQGDYIWKNKTILSGSSIRNDDDTLSVAGIDGLSLRNTEGYTDFEYANIELEGDSIAMSATDKSDMAHSDVEIVQDRITMSVPVQTGDDTERITAELSEANGFEVTVNSDMLDPDTGDPIVGEMHLTPFGLALNKPLGIPYGGHGGETAAEARTNLGITPANIGALPLSGGTMTGDIDMGQATASSSAHIMMWTTADGTIFYLRPYADIFQLTRKVPSGSQVNVIGVRSDGTYLINNQSSFRDEISTYSKAEVDSLVGAKLYSVRGNIVKSASTGTAVGYGKAVVYIVGKTVIVEFEAKITTAGTMSGVYDIGIQVANLRTINSGIPAFTVANGGIIHYYKDDGAMDTRLEGYAGEASLNTSENRWSFGRLYDTSGSVGAWADNNYSAGKIITGTLYGVLS